MSNIIESKVDDIVIITNRRIHVDEVTGRTAWELRAQDIKMADVPRDAKYALASMTWHVAMHATSLAEADPAQRAAIEAYWRVQSPIEGGVLHTSLDGDAVVVQAPVANAT